jgi:hypothetical protein
LRRLEAVGPDQETDCVTVPVYTPPTAEAGAATLRPGFQVAVLSPTPDVPVTTGVAVLDRVIGVPVAVMVPVVVIDPGSYPTSRLGMVSAAVPPPVVKSEEAAVTVQAAESSALSSVTVTAPSVPEMVVPAAPDPRATLTGALMDRAPEVTVNVTVVLGSDEAQLGTVQAVTVGTLTSPVVRTKHAITRLILTLSPRVRFAFRR